MVTVRKTTFEITLTASRVAELADRAVKLGREGQFVLATTLQSIVKGWLRAQGAAV